MVLALYRNFGFCLYGGSTRSVESSERKRIEPDRASALPSESHTHLQSNCWSHTDTSEPVDGNWAQNYAHCPIRVRTSELSITGPRAYQLR
jgi:hypothetical protein